MHKWSVLYAMTLFHTVHGNLPMRKQEVVECHERHENNETHDDADFAEEVSLPPSR